MQAKWNEICAESRQGLLHSEHTLKEGNLTKRRRKPTAKQLAAEGRVGVLVKMPPELKAALRALQAREQADGRGMPDDFIVHFAKGATDVSTRSNSIQFLFRAWFAALGFSGASSHSGRRTFITKCARSVSAVGGSLRDVQALAGHASIATTQRYIETDPEAQRKLVERL